VTFTTAKIALAVNRLGWCSVMLLAAHRAYAYDAVNQCGIGALFGAINSTVFGVVALDDKVLFAVPTV